MRKAEVFIKARSPPTLLAFTGQVTDHATVKCPIHTMAVNVTANIAHSLISA